MLEGPLNISQHSLAAESPAKSSVPVVGIVIGFLLLMTVAAGGALLWRRTRKGLPGVGQGEGSASERGTEIDLYIFYIFDLLTYLNFNNLFLKIH